MQQLYPLFLDITQFRCLIVGGGSVASRKARGLLDAGAAEVRAVSPEFAPEMPQAVGRICRPFTESDLDGIGLCFAATSDPQTNARVVHACQSRRILVNRADVPQTPSPASDPAPDLPTTFTVPAILRHGPITIAVSASGSPAIAAAVRNEISAKLNPAWADFAQLAITLRQEILADTTLTPSLRPQILRTLASPEALAAYHTQGESGLRVYLHTMHPEFRALENI
jgi:siroheme synthase-like protein